MPDNQTCRANDPQKWLKELLDGHEGDFEGTFEAVAGGGDGQHPQNELIDAILGVFDREALSFSEEMRKGNPLCNWPMSKLIKVIRKDGERSRSGTLPSNLTTFMALWESFLDGKVTPLFSRQELEEFFEFIDGHRRLALGAPTDGKPRPPKDFERENNTQPTQESERQ